MASRRLSGKASQAPASDCANQGSWLEEAMTLNSVPEAIAAIAAGELIVVVDDDDRENEGDLIMAASKATPEQLAFMIRNTSGIVCAPMDPVSADRLQLSPMVATNRDPMRTAFTVSVDYKNGLTTGISADERTNTLRALSNDNCIATDFLRPGHVFPLVSKAGGVLIRSGHTEAATDLCRLAGLPQVGVLAEIVNDNGTVKRLPELIAFAREHGLKIVSIADLIEHRMRTESFVRRIESMPIATPIGKATVHVYTTSFDDTQHLAVVFGEVSDKRGVACRIHHEQPLRDLFDSQRSQRWLDVALKCFEASGSGVLIYVRDPKITTLEAPAQTTDAAPEGTDRHKSSLKRRERWREVGLGAQILRDLRVSSITVIATQHRQYVGLAGFGIEIAATEIVES
jgi:3,4-dihydroxy 2-butanone 4-phosphate synthase / GTP cyclohydrolase II